MRHFIPTPKILTNEVRRFLPAREGATAIEYALIAAGIAATLVVTISTLGGSLTTMWQTITTALG